MRTALDDKTAFHHANQIRALHGRQAMRDDERRAIARKFGEGILNELLAFRVERGSRCFADTPRYLKRLLLTML